MATKQELINDIRRTYGNMLNVTQLAKLFNCDRRTVPNYVSGLPFFSMGKDKKYLAIDIGRRIYDRMEESP
ncbi:hypothetical protein SAMN02745823_03807 [Sporobacter termitidis DSM 10068]|uniref:Uncharacterized protein n=1 Tax=Sporobacter termitidis DSM 10068 TaxID=1123282 RepID=A0A1M5ZIU7_9FIRM|nr:hypothetical protein [Sporobacter termitidis]SHI24156.1 hypothetical protein SAMN02745823_03807 [Sporobacter termitidis DSM 10068]